MEGWTPVVVKRRRCTNWGNVMIEHRSNGDVGWQGRIYVNARCGHHDDVAEVRGLISFTPFLVNKQVIIICRFPNNK